MLSHITCNFYPWNTVAHSARWSTRCLLQKMEKQGGIDGFLPLQVANIFKQFKQKMFSDCTLSSLQKKINAGMFWRDECCSD